MNWNPSIRISFNMNFLNLHSKYSLNLRFLNLNIEYFVFQLKIFRI